MINQDWQKKDYPTEIQLDLDNNNSPAKQLNLIGENKCVIEFGCATGYFSRMLSEKGCIVTGVEINVNAAQKAQKYCSQVIVADLDFTPLSEILSDQTFDVAVFGDVLEHLRDPWRILESVRNYLNPRGFVVASIPNVAHGAVRLSLLQGKFNYQQYGILDDTHIRFFTKSSIIEMFEKSGYFLDVLDRTKVQIFDDDCVLPPFDRESVSPEILQQIEGDEDADTLQFIVRAYPESDRDRYDALLLRFAELTAKNKELSTLLDRVNAENQAIVTSKWWKLRRKLFFM
jgi:O-antigen biosynthesis protein